MQVRYTDIDWDKVNKETAGKTKEEVKVWFGNYLGDYLTSIGLMRQVHIRLLILWEVVLNF
jgi:hypothetical protein